MPVLPGSIRHDRVRCGACPSPRSTRARPCSPSATGSGRARRGDRRARPDDLRLAGRGRQPGLRAAARPRAARPTTSSSRWSRPRSRRLDAGTVRDVRPCGRADRDRRLEALPWAAALHRLPADDRPWRPRTGRSRRRRPSSGSRTIRAAAADVCAGSPSGRRSSRSGRPAERRFLKAESLQPIGAFKIRGAYDAVASLCRPRREPRRHHLLVGEPRPGRRPRRAPARGACGRGHAIRRAGAEAGPRRGGRRRGRRRRALERGAATGRRGARRRARPGHHPAVRRRPDHRRTGHGRPRDRRGAARRGRGARPDRRRRTGERRRGRGAGARSRCAGDRRRARAGRRRAAVPRGGADRALGRPTSRGRSPTGRGRRRSGSGPSPTCRPCSIGSSRSRRPRSPPRSGSPPRRAAWSSSRRAR